ncbi:hypothetical protein M8818_002210 [Zalaria obscura]|uniref:Uncharacterized protein n=1 Tax=Zalaria obscura TaxID=2024903 RepID=A0ACC3SI79_9PEZI
MLEKIPDSDPRCSRAVVADHLRVYKLLSGFWCRYEPLLCCSSQIVLDVLLHMAGTSKAEGTGTCSVYNIGRVSASAFIFRDMSVTLPTIEVIAE